MGAAPQQAFDREVDEQRWSALMARAHGGDRAAYELLMTELGEAIGAYLRSRFGAMDALEDCVQEALLAIHRARHTYDPARPFRPWLFTIVRHRTIDVLRRLPSGRRDVDPGNEPASSGEQHAAIDSARLLERLAPAERQALSLTKLAGYSLAEAGRQCGVSEGAMKVRVHRALKSLKKLLESEGLLT